ncbi:hypothetical protein BD289DRAFT_442227 [Coniella lustricola]|uniref:Rhodopsin domain-containing protein n=1 Tax=Coniella lustricola TaxID=2025994 RepID=A0A2T2ZYF2_9PEZI|nr:hypothetical protein BD289DRAFT_442227 [Coniella lustricola]
MSNDTFRPGPLGMATFVVTIALYALCLITVAMRTWTRIQTRTYALDDGLMVVALAAFTSCCVFTCLAVFSGLGTIDAHLETWNKVATVKYIVFFQITYAWSLPFIKSSICLTMLKIITDKPLRVVIWVCLVASVASAMVGFVAVVALCQPLAYYWNTSIDGGWCASTQIITGISYLISIMAIVTDWTCALIPCFVVWNLQMRSRLKASVCAVLALGIIASAATVIRLPYLRFYNIAEDYDYHVCNIVLWSIVECSLGILAGSLPSLRSLLKSWIDKSSKGDSYRKNGGSYPLQGGSSTKKFRGESIKMSYMTPRGRGNTTTITSTCKQGDRTWMELDDDSSQKHIIHQTMHVSVDVSESKSFNG